MKTLPLSPQLSDQPGSHTRERLHKLWGGHEAAKVTLPGLTVNSAASPRSNSLTHPTKLKDWGAELDTGQARGFPGISQAIPLRPLTEHLLCAAPCLLGANHTGLAQQDITLVGPAWPGVREPRGSSCSCCHFSNQHRWQLQRPCPAWSRQQRPADRENGCMHVCMNA